MDVKDDTKPFKGVAKSRISGEGRCERNRVDSVARLSRCQSFIGDGQVATVTTYTAVTATRPVDKMPNGEPTTLLGRGNGGRIQN